MAISKERKAEIVEQHEAWLQDSKAVVLTEYVGLSAKELEQFRLKVREAGGEIHVVKNTLSKLMFEKAGLSFPEDAFEGSTAIGYAFTNAPDLAKAITDFAKDSDFIKVKAGVLGQNVITAEEVKALADLPPLDVIRAQLLGTLMAPATKVVRILAEPGRQIAAVVKAYTEKEASQTAA